VADPAERLWLSREGRERWREALAAPKVNPALVSLALVGLKAHCRRFRRLQVGRYTYVYLCIFTYIARADRAEGTLSQVQEAAGGQR